MSEQAEKKKPDIALTERERIVLQWSALGKSVGVTAQITGLSEMTVRRAKASIQKKLGSQNFTQCLVVAGKLGLLDEVGAGVEVV